MAPLIQDTDIISLSGDDEMLFATLHESCDFALPSNAAAVPQHKKQVCFGALNEVHEVMNRYDYTEEELEASWYDREDMKIMKNSAKSDARLYDTGVLQPSADFSERGLEHRTRQGLKSKRNNRLNAYAAVFFEIDFQFEGGFVDDDAIADCYFEQSEACQMAAEKLARRDEIEAQKVYNNDVTMEDEKSQDFFGPMAMIVQ